MTSQTRRGLAPPAKTQRMRSALIPSLWVINALLVGVVILAPASKRASTSPVDNASRTVVSTSGCVSQSCPAQLAEYLGDDLGKMKAASDLVAAAPSGVSEVYALRSQTRAVAHLEGHSSGGTLVIKLDEGDYKGQWMDPDTRSAAPENILVKGEKTELECPAFSGAITLDIKRTN